MQSIDLTTQNRARRLCMAAVIGLSVVATPLATVAQQTDNVIAFNSDWGAFLDGQGAAKRCFAASKPKTSEVPASVSSRGEPFLLVSTFPNDGTVNEVSAVLGFQADNAKGVTLTIDGKSFPMFGDGTHAWLTRAEDNAAVVDAMKRGANASITATSARGNAITDSYSLIGFTATLNSVAQACT